jgi:cell division protein FtsQ
VMRRYEDLQHWVAGIGRSPRMVALSPRYAWTVKLDDDTSLLLGRDQGVPIEDRVKRWAATFPQIQPQLDRKAEVIDLRYPSGFAIRSVKVLDADADASRKTGVSVAKLNR